MTYPQIGNYGVNNQDVESNKVQVSGFIVREYFDYYSNWRAKNSLENYLKINNVIGISEIDTRMLTRIIRLSGAMKAIISTETDNKSKLKEKLDAHPDMVGSDLVKYVTCKQIYEYNDDYNKCSKDSKYYKDKKYNKDNKNSKNSNKSFELSHNTIVALDFGIKLNILRCLAKAGFRIIVVPANTSYEKILSFNTDGIFLSNGPGDPAAVNYAIKTISKLLGKKPIFGICLGHQLIALALGAKTYKLKFGHHGGNHPVKNLSTGRIEITTQNHGFAVDINSLKNIKNSSYKITHINLNDNTIEGIEYPEVYAYSVQHHPEAGPGPYDSRYIFNFFNNYIEKFKKANV